MYNEGVLKVSLNCAREAAKSDVKRFIEVSTGQIYAGDKVQAIFYSIFMFFLTERGSR